MRLEAEKQVRGAALRARIRWVVFPLAVIVIGAWLIGTPAGLLGKADAVGYAVCHRIDLRSFHVGARTLPLCSRCTGMYLGALGALAYFLVRRPRAGLYPSRPILALMGLFALAWGLDGFNSFLSFFPAAPHLYEPNNTLRLVTGTMIGLALAVALYPVWAQTAWRDWKPEPIIRTPGELGAILIGAAALDLTVLGGNPLVLYPLALLSSLGVLSVLTLAYALLTVPLLAGTAEQRRWRGLVPALVLALTLAVAQIALIDALRYFYTGTWDGFHL